MHVLLVEPNYYTRFPPLGLLKLSSYHKSIGDTTEYIRGNSKPEKKPDLIYVTSLFTYAWKPVHESVEYYKGLFPDVPLKLGGIYATLLPEHAKKSGADEIHCGMVPESEELMPDYSLVPEWDGSIIFSSRGCIRKCNFCAVPKLEGRPNSLLYSIKHLVHPDHKKIIFWDNNILANKNWRSIFDELVELNRKVDFNQGIDGRLITDEAATKLKKIRLDLLRIAYDERKTEKKIEKAIECLYEHGIDKRKIVVYTLFNFKDDPEDFFERVKQLLNWGAVPYPMQYQPLNTFKKNSYISPNWTKEELEMVASTRRVIGVAGTLPPYEGLLKKFNKAKGFHDAFLLRPKKEPKKVKEDSIELTPQENYLSKVKPRYGGDLNWRTEIVNGAKE